MQFTVKDGAKAVFKVVNEKGQPIHASNPQTGTVWMLEDCTAVRDARQQPAWRGEHDELTLLPAFGEFTGGHVLRPSPGDRLFAVAGDRVCELPSPQYRELCCRAGRSRS